MANVVTGAKAVVGINTGVDGFIPIAFAASINITHENRLEEIPQLDSLEVVEYAENGHRCSFSVNFFKLADINAQTYGLDYESLEELLIQPELEFQVLSDEPIFSNTGVLTFIDSKVIYTMRGVKFEGGSGQVNARGVWEGTWNFKARRGIGI